MIIRCMSSLQLFLSKGNFIQSARWKIKFNALMPWNWNCCYRLLKNINLLMPFGAIYNYENEKDIFAVSFGVVSLLFNIYAAFDTKGPNTSWKNRSQRFFHVYSGNKTLSALVCSLMLPDEEFPSIERCMVQDGLLTSNAEFNEKANKGLHEWKNPVNWKLISHLFENFSFDPSSSVFTCQ